MGNHYDQTSTKCSWHMHEWRLHLQSLGLWCDEEDYSIHSKKTSVQVSHHQPFQALCITPSKHDLATSPHCGFHLLPNPLNQDQVAGRKFYNQLQSVCHLWSNGWYYHLWSSRTNNEIEQ